MDRKCNKKRKEVNEKVWSDRKWAKDKEIDRQLKQWIFLAIHKNCPSLLSLSLLLISLLFYTHSIKNSRFLNRAIRIECIQMWIHVHTFGSADIWAYNRQHERLSIWSGPTLKKQTFDFMATHSVNLLKCHSPANFKFKRSLFSWFVSVKKFYVN